MLTASVPNNISADASSVRKQGLEKWITDQAAHGKGMPAILTTDGLWPKCGCLENWDQGHRQWFKPSAPWWIDVGLEEDPGVWHLSVETLTPIASGAATPGGDQ